MHHRPESGVRSDLLGTINRLRRRSYYLVNTLLCLQAVFIAAFLLGAAQRLYAFSWPISIVLFLFFGGLAVCLLREKRRPDISPSDLLLGLEVGFPEVKETALLQPLEKTEHHPDWRAVMARIVENYHSVEGKKVAAGIRSALAAFLLLILSLPLTRMGLEASFHGLFRYFGLGAPKALLVVEQGLGTNGAAPTIFELSAKHPAKIALHAPNLLRVKLASLPGENTPVVVLKTPGKPGEIFQSFQLSPVNAGGEHALQNFEVAFAATEDVSVLLPSLDSESPLAQIKLEREPVPLVQLDFAVPLKKPWPDDEPLPLKIAAEGKTALKLVRLLIRVGKQESRELVQTIESNQLLQYETQYSLVLEPYLKNDLEEVELVAEVTDSTNPVPLVGYSKPLRLEVASAYGRYKETLQTLEQIKGKLDEAISDKKEMLASDTKGLMQKALEQMERTPFFDELDRVQMNSFAGQVERLQQKSSLLELMQTSEALNNFLFEHESLDERERDRDFFVAVRALSRLVTQAPAERSMSVAQASQHVSDFLKDRKEHWTRRVKRLEKPEELKRWPSINEGGSLQKPFAELTERDQAKAIPAEDAKGLKDLAETVATYRSWLEELEKQEDVEREQKEKKRQEGLASAQEKLQELQRAQGKISEDIDHAESRPADYWDGKWPVIRMHQNSNLQETKSLEAEVRALAPSAALRLQAAWNSMEMAVGAGEKKDFVQAETYVDMAGRLLRQAEKDSSASRNRGGSGRRRRRIAGDKYYGQSVQGGDLEITREYKVDERYREKILNEVRDELDDKSRGLLEDYLRRIVR